MQIQAITSVQAQSTRQLQTPSPLNGAEVGDFISAKVTSTDGGRVTLQFPDGTEINAGKLASEALIPGDTVTLEVSATSESGTTLRLAEVNGQELRAQVTPLEYSLMSMDVIPDSTRIAFAETLRSIGLTVSPQTLSRMSDIVKQFPDIGKDLAAVFSASEMPVTAENIKAFIDFANKPAAAHEFSAALGKLVSESPATAHIPLNFSTIEAPAANEPAQNAAALISAESAEAIPFGSVSTIGDKSAAGKPISNEAAPASLAESLSSLPDGLSKPTEQFLTASSAWPKLLESAPELTVKETRDAILGMLNSLPEEATPSDKLILVNAFRQAQIPTQSAVEAQAATPHRQLPDAANERIPLGKVVNDMFALVVKGEEVSPERLREATSGLMRRVSVLNGALEEYGGTRAKAALQTGNAIVTQLKMGNELHNLMYAQIPYQINQSGERSAELYILKRDKSKKSIDDENATVALCLETEHIGRFEALLCVERNDLSLQFRVENERISNYVKSNLHLLSELDFPAKYRVKQAGVVLQHEAVTPVNAAKTMMDAFKIKNTGMLDMQV